MAATLATAGYDVHRDHYPHGVAYTDPIITLSSAGGRISRIFGKSGLELFRVQVDVWVKDDTTFQQAYTIFDEVTDLFEYATLAGVTGFISCRRENLPMELASPPFMRVTGTFLVEVQRDFT